MSSLPSHFKPIRSYVRREGRMTSRQQRAFEQCWGRYGIDFKPSLYDWSCLFGRSSKLVVEIGFGMGESLLEMALRYPEVNFLGIEVHRPGVGALLAGCEEHQVSNIRVMSHDAIEILAHCLPEHSVDTVQLFFPDPWPKKRHHKRRIVQLGFLEQVSRCLLPQGVFHVATDWLPYAESIQAMMLQAPYFNEISMNLVDQVLYRCPTKFEKRGVRLGHAIWDGVYENESSSL